MSSSTNLDTSDSSHRSNKTSLRLRLTAWIVGVGLIGGILCWVYSPVLAAPFIFDDASTIVTNQSIRQLQPLFSGGPLDPPIGTPVYGRPVVNLSFAANYYLGELDPWGYRAVHVILQAVAAIFLWAIVTKTLRLDFFQGRYEEFAELLGFITALLWAVHPLTTECVAYVTQRTELLMGVCYLATFYLGLRYWAATGRAQRTAWLALSICVCLIGMLSKEMMATLPATMLLYERTFLTGTFRSALRRSWPLYLGLAATWIPILLLNLEGPRTPASGFGLGVPAYVWWFTQTKVVFIYLRLSVWPWPLVIHYHIPYLTNLAEAWPWILSFCVLVLSTIYLVWRRFTVGFVMAWVLIVLSPTLVVPLVAETAAERRMFVPLAALIPLLVVGSFTASARLVQAVRRFWHRGIVTELPGAAFGALVVIVASSYTYLDSTRMLAYQSELALWEDTTLNQPDNPLARINYGIALDRAGNRNEAIAELREAVRLDPNSLQGQYNLARALEADSKPADAMEHYQRALEIEPSHAASHNNLGRLLAAQGELASALEHYERALEIDPNLAEAHTNLGILLAGYGLDRKAVHHFEEALRIRPDLAAHVNLAVAYGRIDRVEEAHSLARQAIKLARQQGNIELAEQLEQALNDNAAASH